MYSDNSSIMQEADAELLSTAQALCNEFVRWKAKSTGKSLPGIGTMRNPEMWLRIAKVVQKLGANPEAYIEAQFTLSRMEVFANTLHGETAQKRYKTYCRSGNICPQEDVPDDEPLDNPDTTKLQQRMINTYASLRYYCGGIDLDSPEIEQKVLSIHLHFDPICLMLMHPVPLFKKVFGERAKIALKKEPYMKRAALALGFDIAIEYIEEEDDNA